MSSNGRTSVFGTANSGSIPLVTAKYNAPLTQWIEFFTSNENVVRSTRTWRSKL